MQRGTLEGAAANDSHPRGLFFIAAGMLLILAAPGRLEAGPPAHAWTFPLAVALDLPVNAIAVSFALVMLISQAIGVSLKTHQVIIWGALLLAGALAVRSGPDPSNIGLVLAGVAVMLSGVFDHRFFVGGFGSPAVLELEEERDVRA